MNQNRIIFIKNFNMEVSQNINQIELNVTLNGDVDPILIEGAVFYPRNEYVTFTPTMFKSGVSFTDFTLVYTVIDPTGDFISPTIAGNNVSFTLDFLGTYIVTIQITDNTDGLIYNILYSVRCANYLTMSQSDCNQFTFRNTGSQQIQIEVIDLFNETLGVPVEVVEEQPLNPGGELIVTFPEISLYIVNTRYTIGGTERIESYIINNYCVLEECITSYILDVLCSDDANCVDCPDGVDLNRMLFLNYAYFMQVNHEFGLNNFYSGIDHASARAKFQDIKGIMDKLWAYCKRRNCEGTSGVPSPYKSKGCGCNE